MSVRIMTKVWDAKFPTPAMKLVALKLADCANDDGENIYPSVGRIERDTGLKSTVVYEALADMEASNLLRIVDVKLGKARRDRSTTIRAFDIERLDHLASEWLDWVRADVVVCDQKSGLPKLDENGAQKTRSAWRLTLATPPLSGGVPLRLADPTPPLSGGVPLRLADPTPPPGGPPIEEPSIEPSIEPPTQPSEARVRASAGSVLDELRDEGLALHVVEHLIAPLWGALTFGGGQDPATLLRAIRDDLAEFSDAALADGAIQLRRARSQWPSVAKAREAVQAAQGRHMVRITPGTTAWAAWSAHWHAKGARFLPKHYEAQGYALVPRQFPPIAPTRRDGEAA